MLWAFRISFLHFTYIPQIHVKRWVIFLKSWTPTGHFSNSSGSSSFLVWDDFKPVDDGGEIPKLKEEAGSSISGYEIISLFDRKLVRWWTAYVLWHWHIGLLSQKKKKKKKRVVPFVTTLLCFKTEGDYSKLRVAITFYQQDWFFILIAQWVASIAWYEIRPTSHFFTN